MGRLQLFLAIVDSAPMPSQEFRCERLEDLAFVGFEYRVVKHQHRRGSPATVDQAIPGVCNFHCDRSRDYGVQDPNGGFRWSLYVHPQSPRQP